MSFNFSEHCSAEYIEVVQKHIDECRDKKDMTGMRKYVLYLGMLKEKCGIIERECKGCSPFVKKLDPCPTCPQTPKSTMHGFEELELVRNSDNQIIGLQRPIKPPPTTPPMQPLEHKSALLFHSRNQTRLTETEK